MDMKEFLFEDLAKVKLNANNKYDAILELSTLLYEKDFIEDINGFISDVYERENEGDTNIGQGIAIPHGKSEYVKKTSIAIGKIEPIDWESDDEDKIELIILFAVRNVDNTSVHLKLLSQIATKLGDDDVLDMLKNAKTSKDLIEVFY